MKAGTALAVLLLVIMALVHAARLIGRVEVIAAGTRVPLWLSVPGVIVPLLAVWLIARERRNRVER